MTKQMIAVVLRSGALPLLILGGVACSQARFASLASESPAQTAGALDADPGGCVRAGVSYQPGAAIITACPTGQTGSIKAICQPDGSFLNSGACVASTPGAVTCTNGGVIYQVGQTYPGQCPAGQTGSIVNTCQSNGSFTPRNTCAAVVTPPPTVTCSNAGTVYQVGQSFNSNCPAGQTGSIVNTCQANGGFGTNTGNCVATAPTCTAQDIQVTMTTLIRSIPTTEDAIAGQCGDGAVSIADSYPSMGPNNAVRFFNTCGNRFCKQVYGATSGRVIEDNGGQASVSCIFDIEPQTNVSNSCQSAIHIQFQKLDWIGYPSVSRTQLAQDCVDGAIPTVEGQYPNSTSGDLTTRWVFTCGNRECKRQGFNAGRVIEENGTTEFLECTREEVFNTLGGGEAARQITTTPLDVGAACIDPYFPTAASSLPGASPNNGLRFMNTCGNRFCQNQGFRLGRVNEVNDTVAIVRCTK